jgi:osmotically-inducible protein OsmY
MREDAEIDAQLRRLLADQDEDDVRVFVEWGIVTLRGRVALRSAVRSIVATAERLDGVIAVDEDLKWDVDDVVPEGLPTR